MQPLRCWTCGRSVHAAVKDFPKQMQSGDSPARILDDLGLERYCCRRFPLTDPNARSGDKLMAVDSQGALRRSSPAAASTISVDSASASTDRCGTSRAAP
jgi:DNA-directed RNA polymerase subunit N